MIIYSDSLLLKRSSASFTMVFKSSLRAHPRLMTLSLDLPSLIRLSLSERMTGSTFWIDSAG
jgi:hypothetical protein